MLLAVIGTSEIIILAIVILLIFGPSKLPALGESVGKMLRGFKKEMKALDADKPGEAHSRAPEIDVTPTPAAPPDGKPPTA